MGLKSDGIPGVGSLPDAPKGLAYGEVHLVLDRLVPGDRKKGLVPYYHFSIRLDRGQPVGHLNFRVGNNEHIRICAGHLGFRILDDHRGHGYAYQACRAVAPFVKQLTSSVILTCDPDNLPSIRTIEKLGARFIELAEIPPADPGYAHGARFKRRYTWVP